MCYFNIETKRLRFRKVSELDIAPWTAFFKDNPNLEYLGLDLHLSAEELSKQWIDRQLSRYLETGLGMLAVVPKKDDVLLGMAGIIKKEIGGKIYYEIAYSIMPNQWGKGYATECAIRFKSFAQNNTEIKQVISIIHKENISSICVAKKNGMTVLREDIIYDMPVKIFYKILE